MSFHSRVFWLCLGLFLGFVLGYAVRWLQDRLEAKGDMRLAKITSNNHLQQFGLLLVVAITVIAAFQSQRSSNKSNDTAAKLQNTQTQLKLVASCSLVFTEKTIAALNARTEFSSDQAQANIALQTAQITYLTQIQGSPDITPEERLKDRAIYIAALHKFLGVQVRTSNVIATNPYPTNAELTACLTGKVKP